MVIILARRLIWFDLETTGLNVREDRIVSLSFREYAAGKYIVGETKPRRWSKRLNPSVPIPAETTKIHGIRNEDVIGLPTFLDIAQNAKVSFEDCDFGGYNVMRYDLPLIASEFKRAGVEWSYANAYVLDVKVLWDKIGRASCRERV